jgi:hypothetical protein
MKRIICCLSILLSVIYSYSQKVYFVYLQADPEQAFYVRVKDNVYSSSASGYLILSKLRDSSYSLTVGFPQNKYPEQEFKVDIRGKDHGYLVKNFGEKGWGLYDLQTLAVQMGGNEAAKATREENKDVSAFTEVLAKAANDPTLRDKPVKKVEPKVEPQLAVVKTEVVATAAPKTETETVKTDPPKIETAKADPPKTEIAKVDPPKTETVKTDPPKTETVKSDPPKTEIAKVDPPKTETVKADLPKTETVKSDPPKTEIAKVDSPKIETAKVDPPKTETVKNDPPKTETVNEPIAVSYKPSVVKRRSESSTSEGFGLTFVDEFPDGKKDTIRIIIPNPKTKVVLKEEKKEQPKDEKKFLDITAESKDVTPETKTTSNKEERVKKPACTTATDNDFLKLRKRMAGASGDEGMLNEAVKGFKTRCFSVDQLKNLSTLFLNDAGKYRFFDAAYTTVSDPANFAQLQAELKDEYYVNRFKAMLK